MALVISKDVEAQVVEDRKAGLTYAQLLEKYSEYGVTKKWLERVCKGSNVVKLASSPQKAVALILPLAIRPIGVKPSEYFHILKQAYGSVYDTDLGYEKLNCTQAQKSYVRSQVKEKAAKQNKVAMFVPEWLDRAQPVECNNLMLGMAQSLYDSVEEQIQTFLNAYPELGDIPKGGYSIRQELFALVVGGYDPSGVGKRCDRNTEAVEFLTQNPDLPVKLDVCLEKFVDVEEEYDTWEAILQELGY